MESVLVKCREYMKCASDTEKGIIKFILENAELAIQMNIHELAETVFVSAATVTRLCKKMGFHNYKEYQRGLACELALKSEVRSWEDFEITREDDLDTLVNKSFERSIASMEDTKALINVKILEQCVDLLEQAESITFFGVGASLLVAKDAYLKFIRIKKNCQVYEDQDIQRVLATNMRQKELAVLISYSGKTEIIVDIAKMLRDNSVPVIAITGFAESPLTRLADHTLYVSATEYQFKSGKLASRISQLAIVDVLYLAYIQRKYEEIADALQNTYRTMEKGEGETWET